MKCVVLWTSVFYVMWLNVRADQPLELLRIFNGTTIGLYNLWNLSSVSCGTETNTNDFFRSNIIDSYDPSSYPCPKFTRLFLVRPSGVWLLQFKIVSKDLNHIFDSDILYEYPNSLPTPYTVHTDTADGFELKVTNNDGTTMYVGLMKPRSKNGVPYFAEFTSGFDISGGNLPQSTDITEVKITAFYADTCTLPNKSSPNPSKCDDPPLLTAQAVYNAVYGDDVNLLCNINSVIPIKDVTWLTSSGAVTRYNIDEQIQYHYFNITGVVFGDSGHYSCNATNSLDIFGSISIVLNVTGGPPVIETSPNSLSLNKTDTAVFYCNITASPAITSYYWTKSALSVSTNMAPNQRISIAPLPSPTLTITNLQTSDSGEYFCHAENILEAVTSNGILLTVNDTSTGMCPCSCDYKARVDYWASHNVTNMTYDEIVEWLQPKIKELEKILTVDKTNVSAILNKKISAKDSRPSARNIGVFGIVMLSAIAVLIILSDMTSLSRHAQTIKQICIRPKKTS